MVPHSGLDPNVTKTVTTAWAVRMPLRRTEYRDGISGEAVTDLVLSKRRGKTYVTEEETATLVRGLTESANRASFEGRIADIERACRSLVGDGLPAGKRPNGWGLHEQWTTEHRRFSRQWYACEILNQIAWIRFLLVEASRRTAPMREGVYHQADMAASAAVALGATITEAQTKFQWETEVLLGRKIRTKNRAASERAAQSRSAERAKRDRRILSEAAQYRRKHPDHSARSLGRHLQNTIGGATADAFRRRLRQLTSAAK